MKIRKSHSFFYLLIILYVIHLYMKFNFIDVPVWFSSYFADLLCLPIVLYLSLLGLRWIKKLPYFNLKKSMILFTWLYMSLIFEYVLPKISAQYTSDFIDILFYGLGGILFYYLQKKTLLEKA